MALNDLINGKLRILGLGLILAGCGGGSGDTGANTGGCKDDSECKGDRICLDGKCVEGSRNTPGKDTYSNLPDTFTIGDISQNDNYQLPKETYVPPKDTFSFPDASCTPKEYAGCNQGNVWWFNSCDEPHKLKESCDYGCKSGKCKEVPLDTYDSNSFDVIISNDTFIPDTWVPTDTWTPTDTYCEWQCNDGSCIPQNWVCDGANDCNNGEDEKNCEPTCTDECSNGKTDCISSKISVECADKNGDGCTEWVSSACGGKTCDEGMCASIDPLCVGYDLCETFSSNTFDETTWEVWYSDINTGINNGWFKGYTDFCGSSGVVNWCSGLVLSLAKFKSTEETYLEIEAKVKVEDGAAPLLGGMLPGTCGLYNSGWWGSQEEKCLCDDPNWFAIIAGDCDYQWSLSEWSVFTTKTFWNTTEFYLDNQLLGFVALGTVSDKIVSFGCDILGGEAGACYFDYVRARVGQDVCTEDYTFCEDFSKDTLDTQTKWSIYQNEGEGLLLEIKNGLLNQYTTEGSGGAWTYLSSLDEIILPANTSIEIEAKARVGGGGALSLGDGWNQCEIDSKGECNCGDSIMTWESCGKVDQSSAWKTYKLITSEENVDFYIDNNFIGSFDFTSDSGKNISIQCHVPYASSTSIPNPGACYFDYIRARVIPK